MSSTESDTGQNTVESHKTAVRGYLRTPGDVASKDELRPRQTTFSTDGVTVRFDS